MCKLCWLAVVAALGACLAVYIQISHVMTIGGGEIHKPLSNLSEQNDAANKARKRHRAPTKVRTMDWRRIDGVADESFLGDVIAEGTPVVLQNTPLHQAWKALSVWSPEYISQKYGDELMSGIFHSFNDTIWLFKNDTQLQQYPGTKCWYEVKTLPFAGVISRLTQPQKYGYFYVNIPAARLGPELLADVQPTDLLSPFPSILPTEQFQYVWIGSTSVTTQMHYDTDYNFNLQVTGQKRFLILPPSFHSKVHIFPRSHQHHRRSQINWALEANNEDWTLAEQLVSLPGAIEITLTKGDLLYIPPFWLHHVTNINVGISVNVWTELTEHKQLIFDLRSTIPPLPTIMEDSTAGRLTFYSIYLMDVLRKVFSNHTKQDILVLLKAHWTQRFERLTLKGQASSSLPDINSCGEPLLPPVHQELVTAVNAAVAIAQQVRQQLPDGFELTFGDFIDSTALLAVKMKHQLMGAFILSCHLCVQS